MEDKKKELKKLLYSYSDVKRDIARRQKEYREILQTMEAEYGIKASVSDGMPRANKISDPTYDTVERISFELKRELEYIDVQLKDLFRKKCIVDETILEADLHTVERQVIELKYFDKKRIPMIGLKLNYSRATVYRYLDDAFGKLLKAYKM